MALYRICKMKYVHFTLSNNIIKTKFECKLTGRRGGDFTLT